MPYVSIGYGWETQVYGPATTATSTSYVVPQSDGLSSLRITGTGFTYDVNGVPTGGTITSVEMIINSGGGALWTMSNMHVSMADYGALLSDILSVQTQLTWLDTSPPDTLASATTTLIRILNADGTFMDVHGPAFDISNPPWFTGTVTSVDYVAADGTTILDTVSGLSVEFHQFAASFSEPNAADEMLTLLHTGDNSVVYNGGVVVGDTTYTSGLIDGPGDDTFNGGFVGFYNADAAVTADLSTAIATHGSDTDTLTGLAGLGGSHFGDTLTGDGNANALEGWFGDDSLSGGGGGDTLNGGAGADTLDGGTGSDTADYSDPGEDQLTTGVTVSLAIAGAQNTGGAGTDTLISIENLQGSRFNDSLTGDGAANTIHGGNGADSLAGGGGADILIGGDGIDYASFSVASTAATWVRHPDGTWTVTAGADGVDTLSVVEYLHFTDRDVHLDAAARSFSGNGTSDVLFRRNDGIMASWDVTGTTINTATFLPAAGAEWTALGTGDIGGDGRADIIWQRNDGLVYAWNMNASGGFGSASALAGIGAEWSFLGAGDFNGDGTDDLAWQRNDGIVYLWNMSGSAISSPALVTALPSEWQMAGVGDFNGDGRDDFLWRSGDTGAMVIWQMNGATIADASYTSVAIGLDWMVEGIGDTNGDGRDDIILQRPSNGTVRVWSMDGATVTASANVGAASPSQWELHNIGDYNGDGRDDILWQRSDGTVYVWLLDGTSIIGSGGLSGIGAEWDIIGGG
ncbi:FG-GAP-like repeat-containing protein [Terricaulis sp.]|uniref:FG-GAP-like repeat-containing protein n=1 Tax=Terricaulis sp. TaxID=2768686 RepID=UPI003785039F